MPSLNKQYTFTPGPAVAAQVNTNFDDIVAFINTYVIQKDASKAFDQIPTGPDADPTSANQFTRKSYVDGAVNGVATTSAAAATAASDAAAAAAATAASAVASLATKVQFTDMAGTSPVGGGSFSGTVLAKAGSNAATVDGNGDLNVNFGTPFPHGIIAVTANLLLSGGTINVLAADVAVWGATPSAFKARVYRSSTGASYTSGSATVVWTAFGW